MRTTLLATFLTLSLLSLQSFGQSVGNYSVARSTSVAYPSIQASGSSVPAWRYSGGFSQDDNRSFFIPIGFDFWYDGVRYTQLCVSTNGFIDFSTSTDNGGPVADDFGYNNAAFTASNVNLGTRPALAVFYDDLTAQGGTQALGNSLKYEVQGTAPNRTFVMEWINMAVYLNTSPSLNFQVRLYENTGIIEYYYGTMTQGTHNFTYTLGINAPSMNNTPTVAQLKTQQTANTTAFSNAVQNGLTAMPTTDSRIRFTPPVPTNPGSALSFTSVAQSSMTLNWTNWANNEVGYVIYMSTDGVNYSYIHQTAANATSYNVTGLSPSTLYHWRVYAVTEGCLSNAVSGSQSTLAAGNKVSNVTNGNWNTAGSWLPAGVPTANDNVTILNGHTITINTSSPVCYNLTVGQGSSGTLNIGNNNTARNLVVGGNITINNGGVLQTNNASNTTHTLTIEHDVVNNGTIDLYTDNNSRCDLIVIGDRNQTLSGSGTNNNFYRVNLNMGTTVNNTFEVSTPTFDAPDGFLLLSNGTFKLSSSNAFNCNLYTGTTTLGPTQGVWLNNPNAQFNVNATFTIEGLLGLSQGTWNIGNASNENLISNGGRLIIDGGSMNVAGFYNSSSLNNLALFQMDGGIMTVATYGTTNTTTAPFNITSPGSEFNVSDGSIIIQREGGSGAQDWGYRVINTSNSNVSGGTLQIGNSSTPANQIIEIETDLPVGNLLVNSSNATGRLNSLDLTVLNNVDIALGTLNANNLMLTFGGNWNDQSLFVPTNGTVLFNGANPQTITAPAGETFYNLVVDGTGPLSLNDPITLNNDLTILSTLDAGTGSETIDMNGDWVNNGTFTQQQGLVTFTGSAAQNMMGTSTTRFHDLTVNASSVTASSGSYEVYNDYTPQAGNLSISGGIGFTMLSDATQTARIATATSGTVTGNMTIQRFISGRSAGYSDMGAPVTATTFADWNNELLLSYSYGPPYSYPSAYSYNESIWDFVPVTGTAQTIQPGKGFEVWLDSYWSWVTFDPTTVTSVGAPNIGSVNVSSQITNVNDGWNLIANPYASYISLDALIASSSQIASTILIYDENISDYAPLSTGSGIELAPHQGFWVQATGGSPSLIFQESHKTASHTSDFRAPQRSEFTLELHSATLLPSLSSHTYVSFTENATPSRDADIDVSFRGLPHPVAPHIFTKAGEGIKDRLRMNYVSADEEEVRVPVEMIIPADGVYELSSMHHEEMLSNGYSCILLVDQQSGKVVDLQTDDRIELYLLAGVHTEYELVFSKTGDCRQTASSSQNIQLLQTGPTQGELLFTNEAQATSYQIQIINMAGQVITQEFVPAGTNKSHLSFPTAAGMYLVRTTNQLNISKEFKFVVIQ